MTKERDYSSPQFLAVAISGHRKHSKMSNIPPALNTGWQRWHWPTCFQKILPEQRKLQVWNANSTCRAPEQPCLARGYQKKSPHGFSVVLLLLRERSSFFLKHPLARTPTAQNGSKLRISDTTVALVCRCFTPCPLQIKPCTVRCSRTKRCKTKTNQENFSKWRNLMLQLLFPVGLTNTNDASVTFPSLKGSGVARD